MKEFKDLRIGDQVFILHLDSLKLEAAIATGLVQGQSDPAFGELHLAYPARPFNVELGTSSHKDIEAGAFVFTSLNDAQIKRSEMKQVLGGKIFNDFKKNLCDLKRYSGKDYPLVRAKILSLIAATDKEKEVLSGDERLYMAISIRSDIVEAEGLFVSLERYLTEPDMVFCKISKKGQTVDLRVCGKEVVELVKRLLRNQAKLIASLKKQYGML